MSWYVYTPLVWPVLSSAVFVGSVAAYLWRRRDTPGALPLSLGGFMLAVLCLVVAAEMSTAEPAVLEVWFLLGDALMLPTAILALWFAMEYAGLGDRLTRPLAVALVASVVARTVLLLIDIRLVLDHQAPLIGGLGGELRPLGLVFGIYVMSLLLLGTAVFVLLFIRSPAHRVPVALILVGHAGVRIAFVFTAFGAAEPARALVGVLALDVLALMYAIALTRFRLFDLVPVARGMLVEHMPDPMLVLDRADRVVDLNPAAERMLDASRSHVCGKPVGAVLGSLPDLVGAVATQDVPSVEVTVEARGGPRCWEVRTTTLGDWRGSPIGRLVVLHDVTGVRRAEALLLQHERALTAVQEREHLARDLHDTIGQTLAYAAMQADATRQLVSAGRLADAEATLERLADVARESHREVRGYILELNAGPSTREPLIESLRRYLDTFGEHFGIHTELRVDAPLQARRLPGDEEVQVFRIVQEALANARRHGDPDSVRVAFEGDGSHMRVSIQDDGRGFDVGVVERDGFGLRFMRERAEELGGRLALCSDPGVGTQVVLEVPTAAPSSMSLLASPVWSVPARGGRP